MTRKANLQKNKKAEKFCLTAPAAHQVQLVGDLTGWQKQPIPLQNEGRSVWRAVVELEPGEHRYRFLVDGQWQDDPECARRLPNPFGSQDSVRLVST